MALPIAQPLPVVRQRKPQDNIPQTRQDRDALLRIIRQYVKNENLVPPIPMSELRKLTEQILLNNNIPDQYLDYTAVLLNNELWRDSLAAIPYERRLLLMPKCLRDESRCPAPFDEFGLLCKQCGLCSIQDLEEEAAKLGYAILVAEGSTIVMNIIETGKIEAIVGVSCLNVLERSFPYMEAAAIPGIAIPLLQDDCANCTVDLDWVWDVVHLTSDDKTYRLDLDGLREQVNQWFELDAINQLMGTPQDESEQIAREWLANTGKRWRPFLAVCAYQALQAQPTETFPDDIKRIALAVECFHKASLIHDDIEDDDDYRYGEETLHQQYGIPVALNVGDLLIGEGYRLISHCVGQPHLIGQLIDIAAAGQRRLCQGQGEELLWARNPSPLTAKKTVEIFRKKTAPAFEVALRMGAVYAGADQKMENIISEYSEALGIAYQINDDLDDWQSSKGDSSDLGKLRPSLILAMLQEQQKKDARNKQKDPQTYQNIFDHEDRLSKYLDDNNILEHAERLKETYKDQAIKSLTPIQNTSFKSLLRRVIGKMFNDLQIKGWCSEFETRNAPDRATGT